MDAEKLPEMLDLFAEEREGVAKLRHLVVDLAVSGRLIHHTPNDAEARELARALSAQRAALIESKTIKSRRADAVADDERPFTAPPHWTWLRLSQVGHELGQKEPSERFQYIDVGSIDSVRGTISSRVETLEAKDAPSRARKIVRRGTVIYSTVRPYLRNIAIVDREYRPEPIASTAFGILYPFEGVEARFLFYWLRSSFFNEYAQDGMKGMAYPAINDAKFYSAFIALPPLAEQRRIVAKVDELMGLCDRLEEQQKERESKHAALSQAALARFAEDPTPANLEYLFHQAFTIDPADLRGSILGLACLGRAVAQDFTDEPASQQVERMALADPADPRSPRGNVEVAEGLATLPDGWMYVPLADIVSVLNGRAYKKSELLNKGTPVLRVGNLFTSKDWYYSDLDLEPEKYCEEGDLLFAWSASFGPFIWPGPRVIYHYHIWKLEPHAESEIDRGYLRLFLQHKTDEIKASGHGLAMIHMTKARMERLPVPLPPLAEQQRIVSKVNELMAMADQLESQLTESRTLATRLLDAAVAELTTQG